MPKGPKIPAPGQKGEEHTSFWTKAKWKANLLKGTLELGGKNLRPFGAYVLANALLKNKWVNTLDLSHNHLRNEGAMEISQLLRVNVYLMYLNLASNEITDTGGVAIASAFIPQPIPCQAGTWNRTISILNLSGNSLKDDSAIALASSIMYCADLRKLDVSRNKIRKDGCKALFSALKWNNDVVIVIHNNPLGDDGISHLCDSLAALKQLESYAQLNLELCDVGRRGSDSIAEIVSEKSLFHEVNLSRNNIGDVGCNVLMKSMISNPKCGLKILNLQDALLSDECATSIAHAIEANIETWGTLILSYNKIGDKGGTRLAQAMEKNTVLQNLYLNHNQLGAVAAEALCTLIKTSKTLKFMDVRRNGLSEEVRIKFSDALKQSPSSGFRLDYGATESNDLGEEFLKKIIEHQTALKQRQGVTNKKAA